MYSYCFLTPILVLSSLPLYSGQVKDGGDYRLVTTSGVMITRLLVVILGLVGDIIPKGMSLPVGMPVTCVVSVRDDKGVMVDASIGLF